MTADIARALEHVPGWLMPAVVLVLGGLVLWNQNNEKRFSTLETRVVLIEQQLVESAAVLSELAKWRIEAVQHAERITAITSVLHKIEQHLEHTDASIATINREYEGLKWIKPDAWKRVPQP